MKPQILTDKPPAITSTFSNSYSVASAIRHWLRVGMHSLS